MASRVAQQAARTIRRSPSHARRPTTRLGDLPADAMRIIGSTLGSRNLAALSRTSRGMRGTLHPQLKLLKEVTKIFRQVARLLADHSAPDTPGQRIEDTVFRVVATGWDTVTVSGTFTIKGRPFEVTVKYQPAQYDAVYYNQYEHHQYQMSVKDRGQKVLVVDTVQFKYQIKKTLDWDIKAAFKSFVSGRVARQLMEVNAIQ